jgi:ribulose 1,5-bisphosphate synthetase/thiazole synthase
LKVDMSDFLISRRSVLKYGAASLSLATVPAWAADQTHGATADVLILGAGISGLHAARMFEAAGTICRPKRKS